jgi:hypothetical protein
MPRVVGEWHGVVAYLERRGPTKLKARTSPAKNSPTRALLFRMESLDVDLPLVGLCLGPRGGARE